MLQDGAGSLHEQVQWAELPVAPLPGLQHHLLHGLEQGAHPGPVLRTVHPPRPQPHQVQVGHWNWNTSLYYDQLVSKHRQDKNPVEKQQIATTMYQFVSYILNTVVGLKVLILNVIQTIKTYTYDPSARMDCKGTFVKLKKFTLAVGQLANCNIFSSYILTKLFYSFI